MITARDTAQGPYAWPGGYPLYALCSDGGVLCWPCLRTGRRTILEALKDPSYRTGWEIDAADINYEDPSLYCDHCSERIESAYAEKEALIMDLPRYADWAPTSFDCKGLGLEDRQDWYVSPVIRTRDSGPLERSNFQTLERSLDRLDPDEWDHELHSFGHWGPGWIEILLVRPDTPCHYDAQEAARSLADYPVLDEEDLGQEEATEAQETWTQAYSMRDRIEACVREGLSMYAARRESYPYELQDHLLGHLGDREREIMLTYQIKIDGENRSYHLETGETTTIPVDASGDFPGGMFTRADMSFWGFGAADVTPPIGHVLDFDPTTQEPRFLVVLPDGYDRRKHPARAAYRPITLEEIKALRCGQEVTFRANDGTARRLRVSSTVKRWKRDPDRVEVSFKYGMYENARWTGPEIMDRVLVHVRDLDPSELIDRLFRRLGSTPGRLIETIGSTDSLCSRIALERISDGGQHSS